MLANVVKAVWLPKKSILFTLLLFVVLMYVFTLFAYYFLSESYTKGYYLFLNDLGTVNPLGNVF